MKILFFSNQGLAPLHLGIELETLEQAKKQGHDVVIVKCNSRSKACYFNPCGNILACAICESRSQIFHAFEHHDNIRMLEPYNTKINKIEVPTFDNLEELLDYTVDDVPIGRGVASSIISMKRDYEINSKKYAELIEIQIRVALTTLYNFEELIKVEKPDYLYFFNGRFAECYPLIGLSKKYNIPYKTLEVASSSQKYEIFDNTLPHSINYRQQKMSEFWNNSNHETATLKAIEWYEKKRKGIPIERINLTQGQEIGTLPINFDTSKKNIAIFNSSEDEMKVIEEWQHSLYSAQNEIINWLAQTFETNQQIHFWLRVHPNLGAVKNSQVEGISKMKYKNLSIISANSKVDTYELMSACDKIITFGSTTGIEATYWRKVSLLIGRSFYDNQDAVYHAQSLQQLQDWIINEKMISKPKENTYKYAYYFSNYGTPYQHFKYQDKYNAWYKGKLMKRTTLRTLWIALKYTPNIPKWLKFNRITTGRHFKLSDIIKLYNQIEKS